MPIRKRLDIRGHGLVFITTTANEWTPVFRDEETARVVVNQLRESLDYHRVLLAGYVLMPTHLHMMLGFRHIEKLSGFMQSFKILSSKSVKAIMPEPYTDSLTVQGKFRLWKPRFDDLVITSEQQFRVKLEYIHNNPVKARLVENACDWKYSSAGDWLKNVCGSIPIDKEFAWIE